MANQRAIVLVLDSSEPEKLADFYAQLLGGEIQVETDLEHLTVSGPGGPYLQVRRNENMVPPVWPQAGITQQTYVRLLVAADEVDQAEREIIGLGGQPLDVDENGSTRDVRAFADPSGHPFTLATA
ncbi:VOC family protein [Streptomyces sp. 549]|uniref:VOC family protein n=1 Tax=Streptomyces sp. 549 TaxID=3049076 RepID=UPI0024C26F65|nr:VOC family protein [Streptomyces sp. 549]MDK1472659.1 VOC family protein [Streptomyces sp. 549]